MHKTVKILPPKKPNVKFHIINNFTAPSGYSINNHKIKIKKEDKILLGFMLKNVDNFIEYRVNYPEYWVKINLLDENLDLVEENFKIVKEDGIIIETKEIEIENFNFEVLLMNNEEVIDMANIFVV